MTIELVISRNLFVSGPHYDTTVEVGSHGGVTITQSTETAANPDQRTEVVVLTAEEWRVVEDHVSTVEAIYSNPDRDTPAYAADRAAQGGEDEVPEWFKDHLRAAVQQKLQEIAETRTPFCTARDLASQQLCALADGHEPIRWRAGTGASASTQHVAAHVTTNGVLFWAGV